MGREDKSVFIRVGFDGEIGGKDYGNGKLADH